jgi:4,5-DOPA dioxygenase extradiol
LTAKRFEKKEKKIIFSFWSGCFSPFLLMYLCMGRFIRKIMTAKMPVLFLGHGSPMNAIEDNEFSRGWKEVGKTLPKLNAVLCISAHWETRGILITAMESPKTIHDFGGFPKELFDVQYPAPGSPELAKEIKEMIKKTEVALDEKWGLDHGCWSVVKHLNKRTSGRAD